VTGGDDRDPGGEAVCDGVVAHDRAVMRARLAVMAAARDTDRPSVAALRALLRNDEVMSHVVANVETWPPLDERQLDVLAGILHPDRRPGGSHPRPAA
jgi:hypothetical protein